MGGNNRGLSLFEMLVVVTIVGVLSVAAVPVAEISYIKAQETRLEENLDAIRVAIKDWYRESRISLTRQVSHETVMYLHESQFYPPNLIDLVNPTPPYTYNWTDENGDPVTAEFYPQKYLANIPQDPFVGAPVWNLHYASGTAVGLFENGDNRPAGVWGLFDVSPNGDPVKRRGFVQAIDGTKYEDW